MRGLCVDPHNLVVSRLAARREKDFEFAAALLHAGLIDADVSASAQNLDAVPASGLASPCRARMHAIRARVEAGGPELPTVEAG